MIAREETTTVADRRNQNPQSRPDMFQSFSGSSRRPRQVNLSGQNLNPFAASSWSPSASGTQKTVATAQQERQQRQQERDRLNASRRIQRIWRGHRVRRELANSRRCAWDEANTRPQDAEAGLVDQVQLIPHFFNQRRKDDIDRLVALSQRISQVGYETFLQLPEIQPLLPRLAAITLDALRRYV